MCLGAIVVACIGHLHLGAIDPTWLGIERLPDLNDEVAPMAGRSTACSQARSEHG